MQRVIGLLTGLVVAAAGLAIAPAPAQAELATPVYRTDGVDGRFSGPTTNAMPSQVWDMEVIGNTVYVAGKFQEVVEARGSWPRIGQAHLAAFDATSGRWIEWWRPQIDAPVWALDQTADGSLLAAGEFDTVNGEAHGNIVALDPRSGEIDPRFRAGVERTGSSEQSVVRDLYRKGNQLYIIGNFSHVTGGPNGLRSRFYKAARLDATNGTPDTVWKPVISGRSGWGIVPSADGQRVHLAGEFSYVNGAPDSALLAAVDSTTGASVPGWDGGSNATFFSMWPLGGIVFDIDVYGNNLFVGGAEHYWEMRDSRTGASLKYVKTTNDTQNVDVIGDRVFIGCHCDGRRHYSPNKQVRQVNAATGQDLPDFTNNVQSGEGGWGVDKAPDGCIWAGGDFYGTTQLAGQPAGQAWVGRIARFCDSAGPQPHNVPSLLPPGAPDPATMLIAPGADWRYLADGTHPSGWTTPGFVDTSWSNGRAELGFGDGDETTVIPDTAGGQRIASALFRKTFQVADPGAVPYLTLSLSSDDGATVWINGVPVAAENMPSGDIGARTLALDAVWGPAEHDFTEYRVPSSMLVAGSNTVAVSVHQSWVNSVDLTFDLGLAVGEGDAGGLVPQPDIRPVDQPGGGGPAPVATIELVKADDEWRYVADGSDQGTAWRSRSFSDKKWATGRAELGYGDGDERTVISEGRTGPDDQRAVTSYFRRKFKADPSRMSELIVGLLRDDGAVVYLNGTELLRDNMPDGPISFSTLATDYAFGSDETTFHSFVVPKDLLVKGDNYLAVEVHSSDRGSQDISFALTLGGR